MNISISKEFLLAAAVKEARKNLCLQQNDLAKRSGLSQATISAIERGDANNLRSSTISALEKALGWEDGFVENLGNSCGDRESLSGVKEIPLPKELISSLIIAIALTYKDVKNIPEQLLPVVMRIHFIVTKVDTSGLTKDQQLDLFQQMLDIAVGYDELSKLN